MIADQDIRSTLGAGLRRDRIDFGLTPGQKAYCRGRADGLGPTEAYRQAFNCKGSSPATIQGHAQDLEGRASIVELVSELQASKGQHSSLVPRVERIDVSKDFVVQGIAQIAVDKTVKANTRLSAYVHLGKVNGVDAFRDIVVHEKRTRTVEEIDLEIARHLENMIDVTPNAPSGSLLPHEPVQPMAGAAKDRRRKPTPG